MANRFDNSAFSTEVFCSSRHKTRLENDVMLERSGVSSACLQLFLLQGNGSLGIFVIFFVPIRGKHQNKRLKYA